MIYQLKKTNTELFDKLKPCHYGRRIKSHFAAYSDKYDFSRFFAVERDERIVAVISLFNSSLVMSEMTGCSLGGEEIEELALFIQMNRPASVELDPIYASRLQPLISDIYGAELRTEFAYCARGELPELEVDEFPKLDDVFDILRECFPALRDSRGLWIADTSHRIRRGMSQSFLMGGCTTATIQYTIEKIALVGHVATKPEFRGHFYARRLLYWIGERLADEGWDVRLLARPNRVSYYEEIGFAAIAHDMVFELKNENI